MQYQAEDPLHYLSLLDDDWRKTTLLALRQLILDHPAQLKESINYKMLGFGDDNTFVFHLNAQKHFVGLYIGNIAKIKEADDLLADFDCGKGCIHIKKKNDILPNIAKLINLVINQHLQGQDTGC